MWPEGLGPPKRQNLMRSQRDDPRYTGVQLPRSASVCGGVGRYTKIAADSSGRAVCLRGEGRLEGTNVRRGEGREGGEERAPFERQISRRAVSIDLGWTSSRMVSHT